MTSLIAVMSKHARRVTAAGFSAMVLFVPNVSAASDDAAGRRWSFDPGVGLEGRAQVAGEGSFRIEMECGNGGGPAITLISSSLSKNALGIASKMTIMQFEVDGRRFDEKFECHPDGMSCGSFGFPSGDLITAMRRGTRLVLRHADTFLTEFKLAGSNAAISRLSACLGASSGMTN